MEILTTARLHGRGYTRHDIDVLLRTRQATRLQRGVYRLGEEESRDLVHAARAANFPGDVLALESAALLHGLPLFGWPPNQVQLIHPGTGRSHTREGFVLHSSPLPDEHLTMVDGQPVTTVARTVVDLSRQRGLIPGLIAWDAARWTARLEKRLEAFDRETAGVLELLHGRRGIARARLASERSSAFSQSPMETRSLNLIREFGFPEPVQQFDVYSAQGLLLGRADFGWPEHGLLGEFDGKDKYDVLAQADERPADVFHAEKWRQQSMEHDGWIVRRWADGEVNGPPALRTLLRSGFAAAAARPWSLPWAA